MRGVAQRSQYGAIELQGGGTASQSDRDNNQYTATARLGYEVSPAITPFVEGEAGIRVFDEKRDRNGDIRDSTIFAARGGIELDLGEKLTGEISAGYRIEDLEDPGLRDLEAYTLDADLNWSPWRGTNVNLKASTGFEGATRAGESGSTVRSADVSFSREVSDRLTLSADGGVRQTDPDGTGATVTLWSAGAGFNYWINRFMALTGKVEYENQESFDRSQSYDATSVRTGLRFQR